MNYKKNCFLMITLMALCLNSLGCGGANAEADQPDLGLVKGAVSLDGEPLAGASVSFYPDSGRTATGITDANGNYELIYIRNTLGCKLGHSKVIIDISTEDNDAVEDNEEFGNEDDEKIVVKSKPVVEKIPSKYNTETELEAIVKEGENTFDFNLSTNKK